MRRATLRIPTLSVLAALAIGGCGNEKIEADVTYLADRDAPTAAADAWLELIFAPDSTFELRMLRIRVDGKWLLNSPDDPTFVTLEPEGAYVRRVVGLLDSAHIFQVVEMDGDVLLTTAPLRLAPSRSNQLVVYGGKARLEYAFFDNGDAERASVPEGMVLARVMNLMGDRPSVALRTCPAKAGSLAALDGALCTVVADGLGYGQIWQALVPRETNLAVPCDPMTPEAICRLWQLGPTCHAADPSVGDVPVKTSLFVLTRRTPGVFEGYDLPSGATCVIQ